MKNPSKRWIKTGAKRVAKLKNQLPMYFDGQRAQLAPLPPPSLWRWFVAAVIMVIGFRTVREL